MTSLDDFIRKTAANYLQSVVFVDDKIYVHQSPQDNENIIPNSFSGLKSQYTDETASTEKNNAGHEEENSSVKHDNAIEGSEVFHPRDLMESFARYGIVCALYEPRKGFKSDPTSDLFCLCERADVVILDWDLHTDDGDGVSALLAELIKKSAAALPHHVRLCALYTDRPNLHQIMDRLLEKLTQQGCPVDVIEEKLQLISGATRISIFGKPHTAGRPPEDKPYEVEEADLADTVISEFASLHHGLMPAFALHGLASVRRNTKRLMDRFDAKLDGAFLLHRALVLDDRDAFDELPDLLSDEILAVLEDTRLNRETVSKIASAAIEQLPIVKAGRTWTNSAGKALDCDPIFRELLLGGETKFRASLKKSNQEKELGKGGFRGITAQLLKDFDEKLNSGESWAERLAALFCNRTQYGDDGRKLSFGTVVRHKNNEESPWEYSVCLMPICDSQRLTEPWNFPFWRLKADAKSGNVGKRNGIVIIDPENNTQCLAAGGKIRGMLWQQKFIPSQGGTVVAKRNDNRFRFDVQGMIIEWVAELKPLHAQRIAAHMGTEATRIGLVESEWLRLFCDR
ncbi:MAG: hypothetical protein KKB30_12870 [Proteobacteria bacterium]|nr:hypothetical protein [Pseudomonadota bacterium]MBU1717306.1 hypothetical protein [Pseudomonadota bacterium]